MPFKESFVWGAATSSYQIEGAYRADGKGLNIWDVFSHEKGRVFQNHNGDIACDHYNRFKEDVALMKRIGIKAYRFSISWSRVLPSGSGEVNEAGIRFYSDLVDELLKNGIEPYVTLFHWDYPYELHKKGGWLNSDCVEWFANYAKLIVSRLSDRVKYFITFNEPQCFIGLGYLKGEHAPGLKCPQRDVFIMWHNVLKAHGAAVLAMRAAAKQPLRIGFAPNGTPSIPYSASAEDIEAARGLMFDCPDLNDWVFGISWWSDPVVLGEYPQKGLEKYREYLPEMTQDDMRLIHQPLDFYGQNIYQGVLVRADNNGDPELVPWGEGHAKTAMNWYVTPECLRWGAKFLCERYKLPLYITENGISAHDAVSSDGKVHDVNRIDFLEKHIGQLEKAADEGNDIAGYFQWSLMDNFEWACGYNERFGLVYVDYKTQKRIIKDSGYWYKSRIEVN